MCPHDPNRNQQHNRRNNEKEKRSILLGRSKSGLSIIGGHPRDAIMDWEPFKPIATLKAQAKYHPGLHDGCQMSAIALRAEGSTPNMRVAAMDGGPFSNILNPGTWVLMGRAGLFIFLTL
jgi:hypothetical protein